MKYIRLIATILLGAFMIFSGVNHFLQPAFYDPFIPGFVPKALANYGSGIVEIALGIGLFWPRFRYRAAQGVFVLMLIFLPLHLWDLVREDPAIGSQQAAIIRVIVQVGFIAWAWWLSKKPVEPAD